MFTIDVVTLFPSSSRRSWDFRSWAAPLRAGPSACATIICSTSSPRASGQTTRPSAAARAWCSGSSPSRERSTASSAARRGTSGGAIVVPMPIGERFPHADAERWAKLDRLVIVCGHYEGIDDRLAPPLSGRRAVAWRFCADRRRDSGARLYGRYRTPPDGNATARVSGKRIVRGRPARLPELHPACDLSRRRRAGGPPLRRSCEDRAVAPRAVAQPYRRSPARLAGRPRLAGPRSPMIVCGGSAGLPARLFLAPSPFASLRDARLSMTALRMTAE